MAEMLFGYIMRVVFTVVYAPMKLFKTRPNKVVFLSRQSSTPSIDAQLVMDELRRQNPDVEIATIIKRAPAGAMGFVKYFGYYLQSLYHLATSKVAVLESYWPPVSICHHKPELKVVQMWHAMGKIKQSGLATLGKPGGRSASIARVMHMHEGNDFIIAGGPAWDKAYCESFGCQPEILRHVGLPRIDYLYREKNRVSAQLAEAYPELMDGAPILLFAPTFRRTGNSQPEALLQELQAAGAGTAAGSKYHLVVKNHPNQKLDTGAFDVFTCPEVSSMDMLCVADYLITDYSAIAVEGAAFDVKTLYYVPDYDTYRADNGMNIDLYEEMPGCVFADAAGVRKALEQTYPIEVFQGYQQKFLPERRYLGHAAEAIANIIFDEAGLAR